MNELENTLQSQPSEATLETPPSGRLLIAEDDLVSRKMLAAIVQKWGFDPLVTADGAAALEVLQAPDAPRLVILDWSMPEMDGLEVCRRVRLMETQDPPYIIMLTSKSEKADAIQVLDAGANDFISKPYDPGELRARIAVGKRMLDLQEQLNEALKLVSYQAIHDHLTGLLSRGAVMDALDRELSRANREKRAISIGMVDVDFFKRVNDTYGHPAGDEALRSVARTLASSLRPYDYVGRYGGEEFLVVLPLGGDISRMVFQRLCNAVASQPVQTESGAIPITISVGVAESVDFCKPESLLSDADAALYQAKRNGRNRINTFARP